MFQEVYEHNTKDHHHQEHDHQELVTVLLIVQLLASALVLVVPLQGATLLLFKFPVVRLPVVAHLLDFLLVGAPLPVVRR